MAKKYTVKWKKKENLSKLKSNELNGIWGVLLFVTGAHTLMSTYIVCIT